jgi:hypothetical protein
VKCAVCAHPGKVCTCLSVAKAIRIAETQVGATVEGHERALVAILYVANMMLKKRQEVGAMREKTF